MTPTSSLIYAKGTQTILPAGGQWQAGDLDCLLHEHMLHTSEAPSNCNPWRAWALMFICGWGTLMGRKRAFESKSDTLYIFSECTMYVEMLSIRFVESCLCHLWHKQQLQIKGSLWRQMNTNLEILMKIS